MPQRDAEQVLRLYPRIYFACHTRHVRDPETGNTLSRHQASVLSHLDDVDPTSVSELAEHLGVTASTMSLMVSRLERGGYLRRTPSPADARVVHLRLTAAGVRIRDAQSVLDAGRVEHMLAQLPVEQRRHALHGLQLLAQAADQMVKRRTANKGGNK